MAVFDLLRSARDVEFARNLWDGLGEEGRRILIIPAVIYNPDDPATGTGELRASAFIPAVLVGALGLRRIEVRFPNEFRGLNDMSDDDLGEILGRDDIIALGGPEVNTVVKLAADRWMDVDPWLCDARRKYMADQTTRDHAIYFRNTGPLRTRYKSDMAPGPDSMIEDYGVVMVRPNCFSVPRRSNARIIICYGAHTYGTEAAARMYFGYSSSKHIVTQMNRVDTPGWRRNFDALVRVTAMNSDSSAEIHARRLESDSSQPRLSMQIVEPQELAGPIQSNFQLSQLSIVTRISRFGFLYETFGRLWLYVALGLVCLSIAFGNLDLFIVSAFCYIAQWWAYVPVQPTRKTATWFSDALFGIALLLAAVMLTTNQTLTPYVAVVLFIVIVRAIVVLDTHLVKVLVHDLRLWLGLRISPSSLRQRFRLTKARPEGVVLRDSPVRPRPGSSEGVVTAKELGMTESTDPMEQPASLECVQEAMLALGRELADLLPLHRGRWVAYHMSRQLEVGDARVDLLQKWARIFPRQEVHVMRIREPDESEQNVKVSW